MRMDTDDDVYAVDDIFLGPPRMTLPFRARYQAYVVGAALMVLLVIVLHKVGLLQFWPTAFGALTVVWATSKIMQHVSYDRTVKSLLITGWYEVRAPRARRPSPVVFRPVLRRLRRSRDRIAPAPAASPAAVEER